MFAMQEKDADIIKGASYYIMKGYEKDVLGHPLAPHDDITFYSALGDAVAYRSVGTFYRYPEVHLDPQTPKPCPVKYSIEWWPGIYAGYGMVSGAPGYFVVFKDKNGNFIKSYRYNCDTGKVMQWIAASDEPFDLRNEEVAISEIKDLDLSIIKREPAENEFRRISRLKWWKMVLCDLKDDLARKIKSK